MRQEEIKALLKSLGARKSEIQVYVLLRLHRDPLPVSEIVRSSGLSEKTVRSALESLMNRGLVVRVGRGRGTKYRAMGTRKLMSLVKKRIEEGVRELFTRLQFRSW
ncbi:TPA: GntR family transcriptional regulator [Candidatus Micrarchaeota archaeon]|nr:GntR family transcriptional regulator [Candidatus Micrarchaeota archaeon]